MGYCGYLSLSAAAFLAAWPLAASAKPDDQKPQLLTDLMACRSIDAADQRLACFDRTSGSFSTATDSREIVVLDRDEVKKTKRSLFGFSLPKLPFFSGKDGDEDAEFAQIESTVSQARSLGYGKWSIRIADGATWNTTEVLQMEPEVGSTLTIKSAALGGYFLKLGRGRSVRAIRVN